MALLANSGPSPYPTSFGQVFGQSAMQAKQMAEQRKQDQLKSLLTSAQIQHLVSPVRKPLAVMGKDGKPVYIDEQDAIGHTPYAMGNQAEPASYLQYYDRYAQQEQAAGRKPMDFDPWMTEFLAKRPINPQIVEHAGNVDVVQPTRGGGVGGSTRIGGAADAVGFAGSKSFATASGEEQAKRTQEYINAGVRSADSMAVLKRSIQLLDNVKTGGVDALRLMATNTLGVTGADEAELSANLGKAVLSQLRPVFGAQFTLEEGKRLERIEAGFGKSTEGNKRLLKQALAIVDRAARRGLQAARESGDEFTAAEIEAAMKMNLDPNAQTRSLEEIMNQYRKGKPGG